MANFCLGSTVCVSNNRTEVFLEPHGIKAEKFVFDRVFGEETCQKAVFKDVGIPLVETVRA
jgi:hypothetical protein